MVVGAVVEDPSPPSALFSCSRAAAASWSISAASSSSVTSPTSSSSVSCSSFNFLPCVIKAYIRNQGKKWREQLSRRVNRGWIAPLWHRHSCDRRHATISFPSPVKAGFRVFPAKAKKKTKTHWCKRHRDAKLCCYWYSVSNNKALIGPNKNVLNNGKWIIVWSSRVGTGSDAWHPPERLSGKLPWWAVTECNLLPRRQLQGPLAIFIWRNVKRKLSVVTNTKQSQKTKTYVYEYLVWNQEKMQYSTLIRILFLKNSGDGKESNWASTGTLYNTSRRYLNQGTTSCLLYSQSNFSFTHSFDSTYNVYLFD